MPWDPFVVLGLERRFDLSPAEVERAYLARAAGLHPDVVGALGPDVEGAGPSEELNRARQVLKDPESRGNALLALLGGPAKEQDRSLPDGFLAEMMEVRERMEAGGAAERERWEGWAEQRRSSHERNVRELFSRAAGGETADSGHETLRAIRRELNAWRYIERMLEQSGGL
ncbi:MAG: iron-sulfur cluster co-chaperone HscB C-terminal domain-containing protein [Phycisphaerales bacterium]